MTNVSFNSTDPTYSEYRHDANTKLSHYFHSKYAIRINNDKEIEGEYGDVRSSPQKILTFLTQALYLYMKCVHAPEKSSASDMAE